MPNAFRLRTVAVFREDVLFAPILLAGMVLATTLKAVRVVKPTAATAAAVTPLAATENVVTPIRTPADLVLPAPRLAVRENAAMPEFARLAAMGVEVAATAHAMQERIIAVVLAIAIAVVIPFAIIKETMPFMVALREAIFLKTTRIVLQTAPRRRHVI